MAVGYWKSPTEATYLAPGDTSQNHAHRGAAARHARRHRWRSTIFPADGEYKFSIQNFGVGSFIPGEQLEFLIDGERAHLFKYHGVGLSQGMAGEKATASLEVTMPVKAGSHMVGATFLATNYRPSLDMIRQYDRKSLENNPHPAAAVLPGDRLPAHPGAVQRRSARKTRAACARCSRAVRRAAAQRRGRAPGRF